MRYYLEPIDRTTEEYGTCDGRFEVDVPQFLESNGATHRGFVSTFVFARQNQPYFLLGLDCDSMDNMLVATRELDFRNMDYVVIESSPFRFWVLGEFVGTND